MPYKNAYFSQQYKRITATLTLSDFYSFLKFGAKQLGNRVLIIHYYDLLVFVSLKDND